MLRVLPLGHGLPGLFVPDTHSVRNALGMLKDKNPVPRSNQYSSYPYLYSYFCLPLFAADYAVARVDGRASSTAEYQQWAGAHLERFHYLARWISAVAGAVTAAVIAAAAALIAGRRAGLIAGLLSATSPMFLLMSAHERPWTCVLAFSSLSAFFALRALREPATKFFVWSGAAAGAAAGCHQLGMGSILLPAAATFFTFTGGAGIQRSLRLGVAALAAVCVMFLAGNPYYLVHGLRGAVPTKLTNDLTDVSIGGQGLKFIFDARYTGEALLGLVSLEGVVCALGLAGGFLFIKSRQRAAWILLAFAAPITVFFLFYTGTHARYFIIAFPAIWIFAGAALARVSNPVVLLILMIPASLCFRLDWLLLREDTRNLAVAECTQKIPAHAVVAVEPYGPVLRPDVESLEKIIREFGAADKADPLTRRERLVLDRREPGGFDILPLERYITDAAPGRYTEITGMAKKSWPGATTVASWLQAVRPAWVVRVDRFPGAPRRDALTEWLQQYADPVLDISPAAGSAPIEALLPFEPRLGVWALWTVERPGPRIQLYKTR